VDVFCCSSVIHRDYERMSDYSNEGQPLHGQGNHSATHRAPSHINRKIKILSRKEQAARIQKPQHDQAGEQVPGLLSEVRAHAKQDLPEV
jgi:hypothetical protein